ncbi:DUF7500 family protein [Halobellus sp. GM3]|uniref:DUF7500 family protein n=1 Tax=Halobellus sp. GM3 TaxID=3458410 RepID=UPI00403E1B0A
MAPSDPPKDTPRADRGEEGVIRPDELDYTASERVAELSEGRYVVATDNDDAPSVDDSDEADSTDERGTLARQQTARYVSERGADYGFALTASFGGDIRHHEHFSDDVAAAFGDLATWYVEQIDTDTPAEEVLGILLLASKTNVSYPTQVLAPVLRRHGLDLDDSIGDLLAVLSKEGITLPTEE